MKTKRYRTPKDINKVLKHRFNVYLTENEFKKVKEFCEIKNIKISALVRKLLNNVIDF
ncbi:hypothetical protein [Spiroplasma endosymbiont of Dasysyrphus albostriatus]|uniref:hypothetical protein n=1 Tax=Spiroplasma endosymbiont of Dasysyrphus albostriatus TaxID=3066299 RepID=UPI0030CE19C0